MSDSFDFETRLCDDDGIVRRGPMHHGQDYPCTGSAHFAGDHIRCTSLAHKASAAYTLATQALEDAVLSGDPVRRATAEQRWRTAATVQSAVERGLSFETLLRDPAAIAWLREHGSPEVRATLAELDAYAVRPVHGSGPVQSETDTR